jgi:Icc-related predicted phosphoesterase
VINVRVLSDLHFEFHADGGKEFVRGLDPRGVDVVVLAGDITKMRLGFDKTLGLFRERFPASEIVFIPGNHEYHECDLATVTRGLKHSVSKLQGVHWLDCNAVKIGGRRFLGTTLWYGKSPAPKHPLLLSTDDEWGRGIIRTVNEKGVVEAPYADFEVIPSLAQWNQQEHERAMSFLEANVREGDIVVTHFLPTRRSTPEKFRTALSNCFFVAAELEGFIEERKPALWIHGHTHTSCDYRIGPTRVVCNPFGYQSQGELNSDFDEGLTVSV